MDIHDNNTRVIKIAGHFALFPGLQAGTSFSGTILQVPGRLASMEVDMIRHGKSDKIYRLRPDISTTTVCHPVV